MKFNLITKNRGRKADGRTVIFKAIQLPKDLLSDLKVYKQVYEMQLAEKNSDGDWEFPTLSYEELFRHWMENVHQFDPEIQLEVDRIKAYHEQFGTRTYYVDPTEGPIWDLRYFFEKDGEEVPAVPDKQHLFCAEIDGRKVGMLELDRQGWTLMNDGGMEIDIVEARGVSEKLLRHKTRTAKKK